MFRHTTISVHHISLQALARRHLLRNLDEFGEVFGLPVKIERRFVGIKFVQESG
jgi:hypothetical protein